MTKSIQPLADYVLAQAEEAESKTASGLYLPSGAQEKPKVAKVLSVGPLVKDVRAGERIIYGGYSNTEVKLNGETYLLIKNESIYATVI